MKSFGSRPSGVTAQNVPSRFWLLSYWGWIFFLMIWFMAGCASRAHLSPNYGMRNHEIQQRQAVNPDAPLNKSGPAGLPGTIGETVNKRYSESFKQPPATTGSSNKSEKTQ